MAKVIISKDFVVRNELRKRDTYREVLGKQVEKSTLSADIIMLE